MLCMSFFQFLGSPIHLHYRNLKIFKNFKKGVNMDAT